MACRIEVLLRILVVSLFEWRVCGTDLSSSRSEGVDLRFSFRAFRFLGIHFLMREFRKIFDLPALRLSRADIMDLANLVTEDMPTRRENSLEPFDFSIGEGSSDYRCHSIDELLAQNFPNGVDKLSFSVEGWTDDGTIDREITISIYGHGGAYCQIHALNEVWFKGKIQQINEFFRKHRPWHGVFHKYIPFILGALGALLFSIPVFFLLQKNFLLFFYSATIFVMFIIFDVWISKGKIFPKTDIRIDDKPHGIDREIVAITIAAVAALANIVGVIVQLTEPAVP